MSTAESVDAALKRNDPMDPNVAAKDIEDVARAVVKHWGDQAPHILKEAEKRANELVGKWGAKGTSE